MSGRASGSRAGNVRGCDDDAVPIRRLDVRCRGCGRRYAVADVAWVACPGDFIFMECGTPACEPLCKVLRVSADAPGMYRATGDAEWLCAGARP